MAPVSPLTSVRALFHCFATEESDDGKSQTVRLRPAYAEENKSFAAATPWGDMTMGISNPDAIGFFETGKSYFLDFTPQVESSLERAASILKEEPAPDVPLAPEVNKSPVEVDELLGDPAPADDKVSLPVAEEPAAPAVGGGAPVAAVASAAAGVAVANPETEQAAVVTATEQPAEASIEPEPVEDTPEEKAAKDAAAAAVKTAGDA